MAGPKINELTGEYQLLRDYHLYMIFPAINLHLVRRFPICSDDFRIVYRGFPIIFLFLYCPMIFLYFPIYVFSICSNGFLIFSHVFLIFSYDFPVFYLWFFMYVYHDFPNVSHYFPIYFPMIIFPYMIFQYVFHIFPYFPPIFPNIPRHPSRAVLRRQVRQALHLLCQVLQLLCVARRLPGGKTVGRSIGITVGKTLVGSWLYYGYYMMAI